MSALTLVDKQLSALEAVVHEVECALAGNGAYDLKSATTLQDKVEKGSSELTANVEGSVHKLVVKLDQKDPVTGAVRYGDVARLKIIGFGERCEKLGASLNTLQDALSVIVAEFAHSAPITSDEVTISSTARPVAPVAGPIRSIDRIVEFKKAAPDSEAAAVSEEDPALAEKARLVREKKTRDAEEYEVAAKELEMLLESFMAYLNGIQNAYARQAVQKGVGSSSMATPVLAFLEANEEACTKQKKADALKTALGIMERIISRPDDIAARRLRVTHAVLKDKLTGLTGGIELLCAMGFQARLQSTESAATPENKIVAYAHISTLRGAVATLSSQKFHPFGQTADGNSSQPLKSAMDIFPFLAPSTLWELHLEMQEPAIESLTEVSSGRAEGAAVKLSWLDWFDGLTTSKTALEEALKSL